MPANLIAFVQLLRSHDVRISPAETMDAINTAAMLGYSDRSLLKYGLAMTLAKTSEEEAIVNRCFDQYFDRQLADFSDIPASEQIQQQDIEAEPTDTDNSDAPSTETEIETPSQLLEAAAESSDELKTLLQSPLLQALLNNDRNSLSLEMKSAGEDAGLPGIQLFTQKGQFSRKILNAMGEEQIRAAVIDLEQQQSPALPVLQRYRDILREQVRDYVEREYLLHSEGKNAQFMEQLLSKTRLNNIEQRYLHRVQALVLKMAKRLAARHAKKRRTYKRGQLDMAKTLRRGIANDGIMFNTYWRRTRKEKPQILAICDVSGSVAAYAKFLLLFLYSLQDVLPRVRSFAFSSHLGEVSEMFEQYPVEEAIERVNFKYGGATDYGTALKDFAKLALDDITSNTTVIVLGDARNNNGDPQLEVMQSIYQRARQVIWLNPESRRAWGSGDSEMNRYLSTCHFAAECNNLVHLERIIDQLLKNTR